MQKVSVITDGGSWMGLATAKILGKEDNYIIIVGRTVKKLESALQELRKEGIEAESFACDVSDRASVDKLAAHANEIGTISSVIHAAGMSPHMGDGRIVMEVNALGTINVNESFYNVMEQCYGTMLWNKVPALLMYRPCPHILHQNSLCRFENISTVE